MVWIDPQRHRRLGADRHSICGHSQQGVSPAIFTATFQHAHVLDLPSFLYVLAGGAATVDVLALEGPGEASFIQTVDIMGPARAAGLTIGK